MAEYNINKGIGQSVEFKGLKAQYLFIFAGGRGVRTDEADGKEKQAPFPHQPQKAIPDH